MNSRVLGVLLITLIGGLIACSEQDAAEQSISEKEVTSDQLETF